MHTAARAQLCSLRFGAQPGTVASPGREELQKDLLPGRRSRPILRRELHARREQRQRSQRPHQTRQSLPRPLSLEC